MNFKIESEQLIHLGNSILRGIGKSDDGGVAFKIKNNKFILISSSPTFFFQGGIDLIEVENEDDKWYSIDGNNFKNILSTLPKENIVLKFEGNEDRSLFKIRFGRNNLKLNTLDSSNIRKESKIREITTIDADTFLSEINDISKVVKKASDTGSQSQYLHIFFNKENITIMGTDEIAIAESIYPIDNIEIDTDNKEVVLVKKDLINLISKVRTKGAIWKIIKNDTKFGFIDENNFVYLIGTVDATPLSYEMIKTLVAQENENDYNEININSNSFKTSITNVIKLSDKEPSVIFILNEKGMLVRNKQGDSFEIDSDYKKEKEIEFSINSQSLQSLFTFLAYETFQIVLRDKAAETVIQIKILDKDLKEKENIFIGVMSDDK